MKNNTDKPPIRLLYLTCTEQITNYGVFDTQVKSLLKIVAETHRDKIQGHLFSLMPIIRLLRFPKKRIEIVFHSHKQTIQNLRTEFAEADIFTSFKPLLSIYPFDGWRVLEMIVALPPALLMLLVYVRRHHINVLHCRSYHAGLLGLLVLKITNVPYIFDPRSLWVEEQLLKERWSESSWSHRLWKRLEKLIVRHSAVCIVVSDPMKEIFTSLGGRVAVIYTTVGAAHLDQPDCDKAPPLEEFDELKRLRSTHNLLVFNTGSFNVWNSLDHLLSHYKKLCQIIPQPALLIITRTPKNVIYEAAVAFGIDEQKLLVLSLPSDFVPTALRHCRYGLLVRPKTIQSPIEMSIKFPEYLAAGLPVICDEYIGGAAHVIKQYEVGMLLSDDWNENKNAFDYLQKNYTEISDRCHTVANSLFSVHVHAEKYAKLYEDIVTRGSIGALS